MDRTFASRKLWVGVSAVIGVILFGIFYDTDTALRVSKATFIIVGTYFVGQGAVDFIRGYRGIATDRVVASRKLWITVSSVIGVVLANGMGYGDLQASQVTKGIVLIAFAYIASQSGVDFTATLKKLKVENLVTSRKLWVAVAAIVVIVVSNAVCFDAAGARQITLGTESIAALYIGVQGAVDISKQILRARG
ncbi:MAG: hypothetical protein A2Y08_01080 [Planctomycetes bacterium GWA2_40_7]|nr:MAG: hypothetical protein A2Y08_01080 [Planctomycetes bacterium GWA2_40_7]OHB48878.1 MAG: hypothetical protein A2106_01600 [Planctomycetes bacterium GWF2_40_8]OHB87609.1 MAG: hypothetical protein A3D13_07610 [Planctomycetes bacterium RIFCSPHIGHO2_02_FULL_40_12]OHC01681.1 MAG: hypothetical protein A3H23_03965 [Planctomycetes bacterium RIFCSPLOWO2_12_FULL_40_19]